MVWGRVDLRVSVRLPGSFQNNIWKPTRWRVQLWIPCHGKIKPRRHLRKRSRSEKQQRLFHLFCWSFWSRGPPTTSSLSWRPSSVLNMRWCCKKRGLTKCWLTQCKVWETIPYQNACFLHIAKTAFHPPPPQFYIYYLNHIPNFGHPLSLNIVENWLHIFVPPFHNHSL